MRKSPVVSKVYATQAKYLDPTDCGSLVAYSITGRRCLNASIDLSDCHRKITWYFESTGINKSLEKIDTVINLLTDFKRDLLEARKSFKRKRRKK